MKKYSWPGSPWRVATARLEFDEAENDDGIAVPSVRAICPQSRRRGPWSWGQESPSIRRALLALNRLCSCGASFHQAVSDSR